MNKTRPCREITTKRLRLRQWKVEDYSPFFQLNSDPQVMEYFPACLDRSASDALAKRIRGLIDKRGWGFWAVEVVDSQTFIGFVGLHIPSDNLPFNPCVEIGWRLAAEHWGKGYATEAARAALAFGFGELQLEEIVSFTALPNLRSQRVMKKLGMKRESATFLHPGVPDHNPLKEHCLYRLSRTEFFSPKKD